MLPRTSRLRAVAATAVIGAVLTIVAAYAVDASSHQRTDHWLAEHAAIVARTADGALSDATGDIEALAGFVEAKQHHTGAEFSAFASRIDIHRGVLAFAHIPIVPAAEADAFVEAMRGEYPGFQLGGMGPLRFTGREAKPEYYPIMQVVPGPSISLAFAASPDVSMKDLFGFDLGSNERWVATLERARQTNRLAVSDLIQVDPTLPGQWILFFTPIHDADGTINGFIGGASIDLLLAGAPRGIEGEVAWELQSLSEPVGSAWPWTDEVALGPGRFRLAVAPVHPAHSGLSGPALFVLLGGTLFTALAALMVEQWRRRRADSRRIADLQRAASEKDRFLASLSHEIRTPLTVVAGFAHELIRDPDSISAGEQDEILRIITSQSDEVVNLLEELLVAARSDIWEVSIHPECVDVRRETERAMLIAEGSSILAGPGEPRAFADPRRVRQIIRNLLGNAVRYGGPAIAVNFAEEADSVSVTVSDDGPPIAAERRESMFEAYAGGTRGHSVGSIGLGLFVSRGLAQRMGGDLVYSHDGSAGHFELTLPRHRHDSQTDTAVKKRDRVEVT